MAGKQAVFCGSPGLRGQDAESCNGRFVYGPFAVRRERLGSGAGAMRIVSVNALENEKV
jgi:hypothetical protein